MGSLTPVTVEKFPRKKCHFKYHIAQGLEESLTFKTTVPNYISRDMSCGYSVHYCN
jgi:hypothetical protein